MKKTTIYILSVIVLAIVAASVLIPAYNAVRLGVEGFNMGYAEVKEGRYDENNESLPIVMSFKPATRQMLEPRDTIVFKDSRKYPIIIDRAMVMVPEGRVPSWTLAFNVIYILLSLVFLGILLWKFIRFIRNISKERIFVSENVKLLRISSYMLFDIAVLEVISGIVVDYIFSGLDLQTEWYTISASWEFPWSNLMLGAISLLMAQIWARGIEIQQDQELTI